MVLDDENKILDRFCGLEKVRYDRDVSNREEHLTSQKDLNNEENSGVVT